MLSLERSSHCFVMVPGSVMHSVFVTFFYGTNSEVEE